MAVHLDLAQDVRPAVAVWPSASDRQPGREDLFWRGARDDRLWESTDRRGARSVPGVHNEASSPTAMVNPVLGREDVYWTGMDDHLWGESWAGRWLGPYDLEMGSLGSAPSLAVWPSLTRNPPGQEDLFWKGSGDSRLWEAVRNVGWQGPFAVPGVDNVASAPVAAVNAILDEEEIYWTGTDGHLWEETWAGNWSGPFELKMGSLGSAPSLAVWPGPARPGEQDIFWKGAGDRRLWEAMMSDRWRGPQSPPDARNVASAPTVAVDPAFDREEVYWTGTDDRLWGESWAMGKWSGPVRVGVGRASR